MRLDQGKTTVSHYGLVTTANDRGQWFVDLFLPELMLKQLEIRPGSKVLVQGLSDDHAKEFYLRARSGLENLKPGRTAFTATVRFRNQPKVLVRFLGVATDKEIKFQGIRTFGYRAKDEADLVFEGSVPDEQQHFVYRHNVGVLLGELVDELKDDEGNLQASVLSHEVLRFKEHVVADVGSTVFFLDLPVFRDRFLKVRVPTNDAPALRSRPGDLILARLGFEFDSMTIAVRSDLKHANTYILVFEGADLEEGAPVTNTILENLPASVNVDAISAYEYLAFDRNAVDPKRLKPLGRIEMLCVTNELASLDPVKVLEDLRTGLSAILAEKQIKRLTLESIDDAFEALRKAMSATATNGPVTNGPVSIFNEALNDRYVRLGRLGVGGYGRVFQYLDLRTKNMVAGKEFPEADVGSRELETLIQTQKSKNVVKLFDFFFADAVPVIITELLPITLSNNEHNPRRNQDAFAHLHPKNLYEFAHMATQICRGLHDLHSWKDQEGRHGYVHGDVKPENIGAAFENNKPVWKLIDFGLTREFGSDRTRTAGGQPAGTPGYMSPDSIRGPKTPASDIFALGVTFFEVLCGWTHPSVELSGGIPAEVNAYVKYLQEGGDKPVGFDKRRFKLGAPFNGQEKLSTRAFEGLRDIVFGMMAMSPSDRPSTAEEIIKQFIAWRGIVDEARH